MAADQNLRNWLEFPDKRAAVRRLVSSSGASGMAIRIADTPEGHDVRERARAAGFEFIGGNDRSLFMSFTRLNEITTVSGIAENLGALKIRVPLDRILNELTIGSGAPVKAAAPAAQAPAAAPAPAPQAAPVAPVQPAAQAPVAPAAPAPAVQPAPLSSETTSPVVQAAPAAPAPQAAPAEQTAPEPQAGNDAAPDVVVTEEAADLDLGGPVDEDVEDDVAPVAAAPVSEPVEEPAAAPIADIVAEADEAPALEMPALEGDVAPEADVQAVTVADVAPEVIDGAPETAQPQAPLTMREEPSYMRNYRDLTGINHEIIYSGRKNLIIVRDENGVRYGGTNLKYMSEEPEGDRNMRFLRAINLNDADQAAEIIIKDVLSTRRTWNRNMLNEFVQVLTEGTEIDRLEMFSSIRTAIIRGVIDVAMEDSASLNSLAQSMILSEHLNGAISEDSEDNLKPSLSLMVTMRRLMRGMNVSEVTGSSDVSLAMSNAISGPASSIIDLGREDPATYLSYLNGVLSRRDANGRSVVIIPGAADSPDVYDLRDTIARGYGIDGTLSMTSVVADGVAGTDQWSAIFIGDRRNEVLPMAPVAAQRIFEAVTIQDLRAFEMDVNRSRRKIADFNNGIVEDAAAEDDRESNATQVPTVNMSKTPSFTMTPYSISGAVQKAQSRVIKAMEPYGGVDAGVAYRLGYSIAEIEDLLSGEQVDARATMRVARDRDRSVLLADDAGIGKTRPGAAMVRMFLREGLTENKRNKVIYFTEKGDLNAPDVMENLHLMGVDISRVGFLTANSTYSYEEEDQDGNVAVKTISSIPDARRREIFESGEFPEEYDVVITSFSLYNQTPASKCKAGKPVSPSSYWASKVSDEDTMLLIDEAHNAVKSNSNTGGNLRAFEAPILARNIVKMTATPIRSVADVGYYANMIPDTLANKETVMNAVRYGGEVALEAFTTMMVEDGVMIRRVHDVSNATINIIHPSADRLRENIEYHRQFSQVVRKLVEAGNASLETARNLRQGAANANPDRWEDMETLEQALALEQGQDSRQIGSPIETINKMLDLSVKVEMVVEMVVEQIASGKRPLISFEETMGALLSDLSRGEDGKYDEAQMEDMMGLSLIDQIRRITDRTFIRRILGEPTDLRDYNPVLEEMSRNVDVLLDSLPQHFSASPIDRIISMLKERGISTGEVTGRPLRYDEATGRIIRRTKEERNKSKTVAEFQAGEVDVLAYNASGATGVNMEDSERFEEKGRGQRVTNVIKMFTDVIRFVQGANRTNRFRQLSNPVINMLMSGLPYAERAAQMVNKNLHVMSSSVDGTREHPLLIQDVPDMLNRLGDKAVATVLRRNEEIARSIGYGYLLEQQEADEEELDVDVGLGAKTGLANQALLRFTALDYEVERRMMNECVEEYMILKEEAIAKNMDPTKPKMAEGTIHITGESIFSGNVNAGEEGSSAFEQPLIVATGYQEVQVDKINGEMLMGMINRSRRLYGSDVATRSAQSIRANMRSYLSDMMSRTATATLDEAMEHPPLGGPSFAAAHKRMTEMATILSQISPGSSAIFKCHLNLALAPAEEFIITSIVMNGPPQFASSYDLEYCHPGDWKPRKATLASLIRNNDPADVIVSDGVSRAIDTEIIHRFDESSKGVFTKEVQLLMGNMLAALEVSQKHKLGSPSLFRDEKGAINRAIIIFDDNIDLNMLPRQVTTDNLMRHLVNNHLVEVQKPENDHEDFNEVLRIWGDSGKEGVTKMFDAEHRIRVTPGKVSFDLLPLGKGTFDFYNNRPGLYEALHGTPLPEKKSLKAAPSRRVKAKKDEPNVVRKSKSEVGIPIDSVENYKRIAKVLEKLLDGREAPSFYVSGNESSVIADFARSGVVCDYDLSDLPERSAISIEKDLDFRLEGFDLEIYPTVFDENADNIVEDDLDDPEMEEPGAVSREPQGAFDLDDENPEEDADDAMELDEVEI